MVKLLRVFFVATVLVCQCTGDTLWWVIDDSQTVDGLPIVSFIENNTFEDDVNWPAARVKVTYSDGTSEIIPIKYPDFPNETFYSSYIGWTIDEQSGNPVGWGTGWWSTQSPLGGLDQELLGEALFQMEIGQITWDEFEEMENWITLAQSDPMLKS